MEDSLKALDWKPFSLHAGAEGIAQPFAKGGVGDRCT